MARYTVPDMKSTIIALKQPGESFKGWLTKTHEGKFGILYDGFNQQGEAVSIQPNADLLGRLQMYVMGCYIEITLEDRVKIEGGNEYKKHKVVFDDDPKYSWESVKIEYLKRQQEKGNPAQPDSAPAPAAEDVPF